MRTRRSRFLMCSMCVVGGCATSRPAPGPAAADSEGSSPAAASQGSGPAPSVVAAASGGGSPAPAVAAAATSCAGLFCEQFDSYPGLNAIADKQTFGPWRAALRTGATMNVDGTHKVSGTSALHVHIDGEVTAGGRLFADGDRPIFAGKPTHLYGRMMMYIDANGTSVHWTFFGVNGLAEPGSPVAGSRASYIMSSLVGRGGGVNTYSFVHGLHAPDGFRDCSSRSATAMPSGWACVAFEMDSVERKLRMYKDGGADPILSVDDHGKACVRPTPVESPWYGPAVNQLFVGAWSFHKMNAPLDVWIDDLVVDTKPVPCPAR